MDVESKTEAESEEPTGLAQLLDIAKSVQAAAPAAPGRVFRCAINATLGRNSGGLRGVENPNL